MPRTRCGGRRGRGSAAGVRVTGTRHEAAEVVRSGRGESSVAVPGRIVQSRDIDGQ